MVQLFWRQQTSQTLSLSLIGRAKVNTDAFNPLLISTISSQVTHVIQYIIDEGYRVTTQREEASAESKRSQKPEQLVGSDITNQREVAGESLHCGCCGRLQPQILAVELKPAVRRKSRTMSRQTDGWQAQVGTWQRADSTRGSHLSGRDWAKLKPWDRRDFSCWSWCKVALDRWGTHPHLGAGCLPLYGVQVKTPGVPSKFSSLVSPDMILIHPFASSVPSHPGGFIECHLSTSRNMSFSSACWMVALNRWCQSPAH